jgi:diguanylate cyclase (GGDEF)-like protein
VWRLPCALRWYVITVILAAAAAVGIAATLTSWRPHDALLFGLLVGFGAVVIEFTRRTAEPAGLIKEVHAAWQLPMALLLPPIYCLLAPVVTLGLLQWRTRRTIAHRRAFTAAANGLSLGTASITFHSLPVTAGHPLLWLLAVTGCALLWSAANKALIMTAVRGSDPTVSIRQQLFTLGPVLNDVCEIAAACLLAGVITGVGLVVLIPALPLVVVLQYSFRQAQLLSEARMDAHTGLLTPAAWRAEAEVKFARAQQAGSPIALGIIDLDHFQAINDAHGQEAGVGVVTAVAALLDSKLRSSDLIGRFGRKEFVFLLPGADTGEASHVAERLHGSIAAQSISAGPGKPQIRVTVSIGLAVFEVPAGRRDLTELLAAADAALFRAARAGGDRIHLAPGATAPANPNTPESPADEQPSADGKLQREEITDARLALGRQLAAWRSQAKLTQQALGQRIGYSRSTVASAEAGEPVSAAFWAAADRAVGANGHLMADHARIEAAVAAARRRTARRAWQARTEAAHEDLNGELPEDGTVATADSACPRCGEHITVTGTFRVTAVIPNASTHSVDN